MFNTSTATRTVVGLFDNMEDANRAAAELEREGISRSDVSVIAGNEAGKYADYSSGSGQVGKGIAGGAGAGAAIGGGLGLVAGLTALAIPGFGPIIAAGPIAAALTGAGVGAAAGGLIGGLTKAGVPEHDANYYAEGVRRGGVLLAVKTTDEFSDRAAEILDNNGARDIDEKSRDWTASGWTAPANPADNRTFLKDKDRDDISVPRGTARDNIEGERAIPVVEERLNVGTRVTGRKGVRVYTEMHEPRRTAGESSRRARACGATPREPARH